MRDCMFKNERIRANSGHKCASCKHNTKRNRIIDYYEPANDKPFPKITRESNYGNSLLIRCENELGYKCPVCGEYTLPHMVMIHGVCRHCGYRIDNIAIVD